MMLDVRILTQPDDVTCGPTSLHAVYDYYDYKIELPELIQQVDFLVDGGTLAVFLGMDALRKGFAAKIYSYNLKLFDPSWKKETPQSIIRLLKEQMAQKNDPKLHTASKAYIQFLEMGGKLRFDNMTTGLLKRYFRENAPLLVGLSSTFLYECKRERVAEDGIKTVYDDVSGEPSGHFVVLCGMDENNHVWVADPYKNNPISQDNYYSVDIHRLINSIMLGIVTYDANMLIVRPHLSKRKNHSSHISAE